MRKIFLGLLGTAALAVPLAIAGSANATSAPERWASQQEFNAVKGGWALAQVEDHFDTHGQFSYQGGGQLTRTYHGWTRHIVVTVTYHKRYGHWVVLPRYGKWAYNDTQIGHD